MKINICFLSVLKVKHYSTNLSKCVTQLSKTSDKLLFSWVMHICISWVILHLYIRCRLFNIGAVYKSTHRHLIFICDLSLYIKLAVMHNKLLEMLYITVILSFQASPCGIFGGQSGTGTCFLWGPQSPPVSIIPPMLQTRSVFSLLLHSISNWKHCYTARLKNEKYKSAYIFWYFTFNNGVLKIRD